jgi:hypothetical protein
MASGPEGAAVMTRPNVPRPPRQKAPTYSAIREAVLARRKAAAENPEAEKSRKRGRPRKDPSAPADIRPLPISGPAPTEIKVQGLLERGMATAEQIGAVSLKAQLVAAHSELRAQLVRAREMRRRLNRMSLPPEQLGEEQGRA